MRILIITFLLLLNTMIFESCCSDIGCNKYIEPGIVFKLDATTVSYIKNYSDSLKLAEQRKTVDSLDSLIKIEHDDLELSFLKTERDQALKDLKYKCRMIYDYFIMSKEGYCNQSSVMLCEKYNSDIIDKCKTCILDSCKKEITKEFNIICFECEGVDY